MKKAVTLTQQELVEYTILSLVSSGVLPKVSNYEVDWLSRKAGTSISEGSFEVVFSAVDEPQEDVGV